MRTDTPRPVRLSDYRVPDFLVETVALDVKLDREATRVEAVLALKRNPAGRADAVLELDGDELVLESVALDGVPLGDNAYAATPERLTIHHVPEGPFKLTVVTRVNPTANTKLMGLYRSSKTYCTQCEAEGFRRITYFLDRPDVLAVYTTRIEAEKAEAPLLLANGNPVEAGDIAGTTRHYAVWHDPHPKPSYLFAMVGGDLGAFSDRFVTASGREVALNIYVEHGKEPRAAYAMDALKRSMRWDEEVFGCEYDLDVFNIVAVSDFNMGAMENKGLNIFNDKYVLASPETATDADYANIEAIIAHEYFHNWTGNRVTCRDWFQLCLKEGLTVFRDQEFSSDMRSRPVKRIADVRLLRAHQFPEDAGPLAHPVRPSLYHEINNFYTATVYEKGAEVIRMLKVLIGADAFAKGMRLYLTRHDGEAATIEEFIQCFAEVSGRDLGQFMRWYNQAGTPEVAVNGTWNPDDKTFTLDLAQTMRPTPGQAEKLPMVIPVALGLIGKDGRDLPLATDDPSVSDGVLVLAERQARVTFSNVAERPVPSLLRGFSAPVTLVTDLSDDDLVFLAGHDSDATNRWQAAQSFATRLLIRSVGAVREGREPQEDGRLAEALAHVLDDARLEHHFVAQIISLPSEADIARDIGHDVDPDAVHAARVALRRQLARDLGALLERRYAALASDAPYSPDAASAGRRSLRAAILDLLSSTADAPAAERADRHYRSADNMTDRMAGVAALTQIPGEPRERALADFYDEFKGDHLVVDKWFALQATIADPGTLARVRGLMEHPAFSITNPNRARALIGSFASSNPTQFNSPDGSGYDFLADIVLEIDPRNPQVAARLLGAFKTWRSLEAGRRAKAEGALKRVAAAERLSPDVRDIVTRSLG